MLTSGLAYQNASSLQHSSGKDEANRLFWKDNLSLKHLHIYPYVVVQILWVSRTLPVFFFVPSRLKTLHQCYWQSNICAPLKCRLWILPLQELVTYSVFWVSQAAFAIISLKIPKIQSAAFCLPDRAALVLCNKRCQDTGPVKENDRCRLAVTSCLSTSGKIMSAWLCWQELITVLLAWAFYRQAVSVCKWAKPVCMQGRVCVSDFLQFCICNRVFNFCFQFSLYPFVSRVGLLISVLL